MTEKPNLIFDAGGVLVFPNFALLAEIGNQVGIEISPQEVAELHGQLFRSFDEHVVQHHKFPETQYVFDLFKQISKSTEQIEAAVKLTLEAEKDKYLWATTQPWVNQSLQILEELGYPMAVVSNSEGQVEQILRDFDIHKYFETVIDSFVVGVEKPDSRIFEIALERLGWDRSKTIYIGDIFYVDIWGANQAGLGAIQIDQFRLYDDWAGVRLPNIKELPGFLLDNHDTLQDLNLFPARDFTIN